MLSVRNRLTITLTKSSVANILIVIDPHIIKCNFFFTLPFNQRYYDQTINILKMPSPRPHFICNNAFINL